MFTYVTFQSPFGRKKKLYFSTQENLLQLIFNIRRVINWCFDFSCLCRELGLHSHVHCSPFFFKLLCWRVGNAILSDFTLLLLFSRRRDTKSWLQFLLCR